MEEVILKKDEEIKDQIDNVNLNLEDGGDPNQYEIQDEKINGSSEEDNFEEGKTLQGNIVKQQTYCFNYLPICQHKNPRQELKHQLWRHLLLLILIVLFCIFGAIITLLLWVTKLQYFINIFLILSSLIVSFSCIYIALKWIVEALFVILPDIMDKTFQKFQIKS